MLTGPPPKFHGTRDILAHRPHVGLHQLGHDLQPGTDREGKQPLAHVLGDLIHRHAHLLRHGKRARVAGPGLIPLVHGGPLSFGSTLADAQHLPQGRHQAGDRHLKFHEIRDNLSQSVPAGFDDPNLIGSAGLVPVAERAGLHSLLGQQLSVANPNAGVEAAGVIAGMLAGADSIDDLDEVRHGGMTKVFDAVRAPSTYGTFLRAFTCGHVRRLAALHSRSPAGLARVAAPTDRADGADLPPRGLTGCAMVVG